MQKRKVKQSKLLQVRTILILLITLAVGFIAVNCAMAEQSLFKLQYIQQDMVSYGESFGPYIEDKPYEQEDGVQNIIFNK